MVPSIDKRKHIFSSPLSYTEVQLQHWGRCHRINKMTRNKSRLCADIFHGLLQPSVAVYIGLYICMLQLPESFHCEPAEQRFFSNWLGTVKWAEECINVDCLPILICTCLISGYRLPAPEKVPDTVYQLMLRCWEYNPDKRPTFQEIHQTLVNVGRHV